MALPKKVMNALLWYARENGLTPTLASYPTLRFTDASGKEVTIKATVLLSKYDNKKRPTRK